MELRPEGIRHDPGEEALCWGPTLGFYASPLFVLAELLLPSKGDPGARYKSSWGSRVRCASDRVGAFPTSLDLADPEDYWCI